MVTTLGCGRRSSGWLRSGRSAGRTRPRKRAWRGWFPPAGPWLGHCKKQGSENGRLFGTFEAVAARRHRILANIDADELASAAIDKARARAGYPAPRGHSKAGRVNDCEFVTVVPVDEPEVG